MQIFENYLDEASFELSGKKYFAGWGKYRCDGEEITRDEYMKARQAYDRQDIKATLGSKTDKSGVSMTRLTQDVELDDQQTELQMYGDNDRQMYRQEQDIQKNLIAKMKKGVYDSEKAVKLWQYWADNAAKKYEKEFGTPGSKIFSMADRKKVALSKAKEFEELYDDGEFDD